MSSHLDRDTYSQAGDWLFGTLRRNPEALLLMAAGCCLMMRGGRPSSRMGMRVAHAGDEWDYRTVGASSQMRHASAGAREGFARAGDSAADTAKTAGEYASQMKDRITDTAGDYASTAGDYASQMKDRISETASSYADMADDAMHRGQEAQFAHSEDFARKINESIDEERAEDGGPGPRWFVCECADSFCIEYVKVTIADYGRRRRDPGFILCPGHQAPQAQTQTQAA